MQAIQRESSVTEEQRLHLLSSDLPYRGDANVCVPKLYKSSAAKWLFQKHGKLSDPCSFHLAGIPYYLRKILRRAVRGSSVMVQNKAQKKYQ